IRFGHPPFGSGSFDARKIDTQLSSDTSRHWRSFYAFFLGLLLCGLFSFGLQFFFLGFFLFFLFGLRFFRLLFFFLRLLLFFLLFLGLRLFLFFRSFLFFLWSFLAFPADERDLVADVHLPAFLDVNFSECSILGRFPFHRR